MRSLKREAVSPETLAGRAIPSARWLRLLVRCRARFGADKARGHGAVPGTPGAARWACAESRPRRTSVPVMSIRVPRRIVVTSSAAPFPEPTLLDASWASDLGGKQAMIDAVVGALVGPRYVDDADEPMLCVCLDEALVNAIRHGNRQDPSKRVRVRVGLDRDRWLVACDDEGEGFDANAVPDPTTDVGLLAESGRGVRIMNAWLDTLAYYRDGRTILMARRRADR